MICYMNMFFRTSHTLLKICLDYSKLMLFYSKWYILETLISVIYFKKNFVHL